ncbi:UDP-glucuronosyltransferase 2A1-like isoform X4 [Spea bombifrons]|uniref:UDP-glucuronosyltransferase 2A1-like isoform X4 n=1 Tax=Spea bombifrons TaxID=233779 RepID=UPI00234A8532|nr:UDP-glucuronosyltransferase 2A1-like isoform X4 [Spea bombifrons]
MNWLPSLVLQIVFFKTVSSGKVLAWPTDGSHWMNLNVVLQELAKKGHDITLLVHSGNVLMDPKKASSLNIEVFNVSFSKEWNEKLMHDFLSLFMYDASNVSYWEFFVKLKETAAQMQLLQRHVCDGALKNKTLIQKLQLDKFDVVVSDPVSPCGEILAEVLGVPFVYTLRLSVANTLERLCGHLPSPFSYVPGAVVALTDHMSFVERLQNTMFYLFQDALFYTAFTGFWDDYYSEALADASHWFNLNVILEELVHKGHEVTVLVHSGNMLMDHKKPSPLNFELFTVPFSKEKNLKLLDDFLSLWVYEAVNMSYWEFYVKMKAVVSEIQLLDKQVCDGVFKNKELLKKLQMEKFDVVVADPLAPCGELISEYLGVPLVYTFRFSMGNSMERLCGHLPSPFSYVPGAMVELTDKMSFIERLKNTMFYLFQDVLFSTALSQFWNEYYSEILGYPTSLCEVMGKADIWLIRTYWDFEYPRPTLPNFDFVGGLHCTPAKPLPEEMEEVVQGSGDHGIVVFSLGSMVKNLSEERSNMIAAALSQLPQKVIWRYSGKKPDTLGENTIVYDWIPQNDLLGHPKTKAFITHGGTNGIYEAIYHGIPMVGIPLFADQPDNMVHMKTKGMAVMLDFNKMKTQDLVDAVNTVINDPSYKENALRISSIHHDQPIKPLDRAVFWIEFVMRHKGAKHLRPASHDLTWYQYHCLDVIGFLLVCLLTVLYISVKLFTFCCRKCCRTKKKLKTQ